MLVLTAFMAVPNAFAADTAGGDVFLDAKVGKTYGGPGTYAAGYSSTTQSSWGAAGGYRWRLDDARSLGFEVGYMHFGDVFSSEDPMGFSASQESLSAISAGVNYRFLFGDDKAWHFQTRVGLTRVKTDSSYSYFPPVGPAASGSASSNSTGAYLGFGIGRRVTQDFSLSLVFDHYNSDLNMEFLGLEAEYRF